MRPQGPGEDPRLATGLQRVPRRGGRHGGRAASQVDHLSERWLPQKQSGGAELDELLEKDL